MGFYINEFTYELKQHLNLSEQAWEIIYNDMRDFYGEEEKQSFSGFLNRVFYNFYQDAEGSIDVRSHKKREELLDLANKNAKVFSDESSTERIVSLLVGEYENELIDFCASRGVTFFTVSSDEPIERVIFGKGFEAEVIK